MTKSQIQLAWKKITRETHRRSNLGEQLKDKNISLLGDLLLYAQVLLCKIEAREDTAFNTMIYRKTLNFYCEQIKKYG